MEVVFTKRGALRMRIVDAWWRENRTAAPELFKEELDEIEKLLLENPHMGRPYKRIKGRLFRQALLERCQQWVFYRVLEDEELIVIHTVWGTRQGEEPELD